MAFNGSELLGETEVAGVVINRLGAYKRTVSSQRAGVGGPVAGLFWGRAYKNKMAAEKITLAESNTPEFGGQAHLSVTANQVAICKIASNKLGTKRHLSEVIASMPLTRVTSAELGKGGGPAASLPLTIEFDSGQVWTVEVGRIIKGSAEKVVAALT